MKIVIASCIGYADAWEGFVRLFRKFWPDCSYLLILVTGGIPAGKPEGWDQVSALEDRGWCANLREAIHGFGSNEPILLLQEDFFITAPVNGEAVEDALLALQQRAAGCVRLYPCPGPLDPSAMLGPIGRRWRYGLVKRGEPYRISCQAAIWDPHFLSDVLKAGTTCADFELRGTPAAEAMDTSVLSLYRDPQPWPFEYLCSGISRGRWNLHAISLLESVGLHPDLSRGIDTGD